LPSCSADWLRCRIDLQQPKRKSIVMKNISLLILYSKMKRNKKRITVKI
jgi:hypothetical protein